MRNRWRFKVLYSRYLESKIRQRDREITRLRAVNDMLRAIIEGQRKVWLERQDNL